MTRHTVPQPLRIKVRERVSHSPTPSICGPRTLGMVNPNRIAYCIDVEYSAVNKQRLSWGMEGKAEFTTFISR